MKILGLTGSIGMGKTTAARFLRRLKIPVHDADTAVHRFLGVGGAAVAPLAKIFPSAVKTGPNGPFLDRQILGQIVFSDPAALRQAEAILHPLVRQSEEDFLRRSARRKISMVVLDIPLLFETGADERCDSVLCVACSDFLQTQRVMNRPGMTRARLQGIRAAQIPTQKKRLLADVVLSTGRAMGYGFEAMRRAVMKLKRRPGRHWPPRPRPRFLRRKFHRRGITKHAKRH